MQTQRYASRTSTKESRGLVESALVFATEITANERDRLRSGGGSSSSRLLSFGFARVRSVVQPSREHKGPRQNKQHHQPINDQ